MTERNQFADLVQLTQVRFDADQAKLARLSATETELRAQISGLTQQQSQRALSRSLNLDSAAVMGVDMRWDIWAEQRKTRLNQQLARLLIEKEHCLRQMRQSFAKHTAAQELDRSHRSGR